MTRMIDPEELTQLGQPICPEGPLIARAFGETANPDEYIPRPACEEALAELERTVFDQEEPCALIAPPGMGKSLLLRVFAKRCVVGAERRRPQRLGAHLPPRCRRPRARPPAPASSARVEA